MPTCVLFPPTGGSNHTTFHCEPKAVGQSFLLQVDGAGCRHGAPVFGDDGQVRRAVVLRHKVLRLVVVVWMCGVVCDFTANVVGEVVGGHVVDELRRAEGGQRAERREN